MKLGFKMFASLVLILVFCVWAASWARVWLTEVETQDSAAPRNGLFITVDDARMYVQDSGVKDGAKSKTVVLLGGTGAWSGTWYSNVPTLHKNGWRTIAIDLPPFGYSKILNGGYGRVEQARRVAQVLEKLGIREKVVIVGHSYGGGPATETAMLYPHLFKSLVLVDAALGTQENGETPLVKVSALNMFLMGTPSVRHTIVSLIGTQPLLSRTLFKTFIFKKEAATAERVQVYQQPFVIKGYTKGLGDWAWEFGIDGLGFSFKKTGYQSLELPLEIIWGKEDTITPLSDAKRIVEWQPKAKLHVLPGVGHIPSVEAPEMFDETLIKILDNYKE